MNCIFCHNQINKDGTCEQCNVSFLEKDGIIQDIMLFGLNKAILIEPYTSRITFYSGSDLIFRSRELYWIFPNNLESLYSRINELIVFS